MTMHWAALSLGFLGSLHCLGMCGPLAIGVARIGNHSRYGLISHTLQYNLGRIMTYAVIGGTFGLAGELIVMANFQKTFTILSGVILIIMFLFALDLEGLLFKSKAYRHLFEIISKRLNYLVKIGAQRYPFLFGVMNGIMPCGLVYLALAGSLTVGNWLEGSVFMIFFGVGTLPAMLGIILLGHQNIYKIGSKLALQRLFPTLQLLFGLFLIYRGIMVDLPVELDFWAVIKNPVMCH